MGVGGSDIYRLALPVAARLWLTEVHAEVTGDTLFPPWDRGAWRELSRDTFPDGDGGEYPYSIVLYERTTPANPE
jgi:dihydrofolate reductase